MRSYGCGLRPKTARFALEFTKTRHGHAPIGARLGVTFVNGLLAVPRSGGALGRDPIFLSAAIVAITKQMTTKQAWWLLLSNGSLVVLGIAAFHYHLFWVGVPLILWAGTRYVTRYFTSCFESLFDILRPWSFEFDSNVQLAVKVDIASALQHPSTLQALDKLKSQKIISQNVDLETWKAHMLDSFQETHDEDESFVRFHILKGGLWKNEKPALSQVIHHVFKIPYPDALRHPEREKSFLESSIDKEFSIRLLLVNGFLKLQIGEFSEETSFRVIRSGVFAKYECWHTITAFPLIYSHNHSIPQKFLFLNYQSLPEYSTGKNTREWLTTWQKLNEDAASYWFLHRRKSKSYSDVDQKRAENITKDFEKRLAEFCQKEGFRDHFEGRPDGSPLDKYAGIAASFENRYLQIYARDLSGLDEIGHNEEFTDYYEEKL